MNRAVFFDRDDTLMVNVPYLGDPAQVEIFSEAAMAMYNLRQAKFWLFVVSNQSGVGRGLITRSQVFAVNAELKRQLKGDYIHAFYHSFSAPDDAIATDRKPSPELLFKAADINNLDLANSFFIGDRLSDIECGLNAGCRTVLLMHAQSSRRNNPTEEDALAREKAHYVAADLMEAAAWILEVSSTTPIPKRTRWAEGGVPGFICGSKNRSRTIVIDLSRTFVLDMLHENDSEDFRGGMGGDGSGVAQVSGDGAGGRATAFRAQGMAGPDDPDDAAEADPQESAQLSGGRQGFSITSHRSREQCVRGESQSFLERVFGGAAHPLLVQLMQETKFSKEEIAELKRMLRDKEKP